MHGRQYDSTWSYMDMLGVGHKKKQKLSKDCHVKCFFCLSVLPIFTALVTLCSSTCETIFRTVMKVNQKY